MKWFKRYPALRVTLIALLFFSGIVLVIHGWLGKGQLIRLGEMLVGVALLLGGLALYNLPYSK